MTDTYDLTMALVRAECCDSRRKPCTYHEGYGDGLETGMAHAETVAPTEAQRVALSDARTAIDRSIPVGMAGSEDIKRALHGVVDALERFVVLTVGADQ